MSLLCSAGLVVLARGLNPIPFRTRPLNPSAPMVLRLKTRESRSPPGLQSTAKDTLHEIKPSRHQRHLSRNGGQGDRHETPAQPGANPPNLIHTPKPATRRKSPTVPSPRMKPPGPKPRQDHPESGNAQANDARERPRGGRAGASTPASLAGRRTQAPRARNRGHPVSIPRPRDRTCSPRCEAEPSRARPIRTSSIPAGIGPLDIERPASLP